MEKRIRFGDLVRNSGRPQVTALWTAPEKDPTISRAIKENRVLTVMEPPQQTKFGVLGLKPDAHAIFLVFPRPLDLDANARVIGINYELAEQPELAVPVAAPGAKPQPKARPQKAAKPQPKAMPPVSKAPPPPRPKPAPKRFKVHLRRTATLDETREVEALNRRDAERAVLEQAKAEPFELAKAKVREQIVRAT